MSSSRGEKVHYEHSTKGKSSYRYHNSKDPGVSSSSARDRVSLSTSPLDESRFNDREIRDQIHSVRVLQEAFDSANDKIKQLEAVTARLKESERSEPEEEFEEEEESERSEPEEEFKEEEPEEEEEESEEEEEDEEGSEQLFTADSEIITLETGLQPTARCGTCHWRQLDHIMDRQLIYKDLNGYGRAVESSQYTDILASAAKGCLSCRIVRDCISIFDPNHNLGSIQLFTRNSGGAPGQFFHGCGEIQVFALPTEPSPPYGIPRLCIPSGNTASEAAMDWTKRRLSICNEQHSRCGTWIKGQLPNRIIDVTPCGPSNDVQLKEFFTNPPPRARFVALSHCWGGKLPACRTTKMTLTDNKTLIPWESLPRTFQEAVAFTRRLEIQYLWIDCICIVQDDVHDWRTQSNKMTEVFGDSFLTLAAAYSSNCDSGLFSEISHEYKAHKISNPWDDENGCQLYARRVFKGVHDRSQDDNPICPLFSRAWVYQERLLPARVLYFMRDELMWTCRETVDCECINAMSPLGDSALNNPDLWLHNSFDFMKIYHDRALRSPSDIERRWLEIVSEFSGLRLTKETDKLPAIAGIAKLLQVHRPDAQYLAGLWSNTLRQDMLWEVQLSPPPRRPSCWRAPTWSWASVDQSSYSEHSYTTLFFIEVLEVSCQYVDEENPFGEVLSGRITLQGQLSACSLELVEGFYWHVRPHGLLNQTKRLSKNSISEDYDFGPSNWIKPKAKVYILKMGQSNQRFFHLVLRRLNKRKHIYYRIGLIWEYNSYEKERLDAFASYKREIITIE